MCWILNKKLYDMYVWVDKIQYIARYWYLLLLSRPFSPFKGKIGNILKNFLNFVGFLINAWFWSTTFSHVSEVSKDVVEFGVLYVQRSTINFYPTDEIYRLVKMIITI